MNTDLFKPNVRAVPAGFHMAKPTYFCNRLVSDIILSQTYPLHTTNIGVSSHCHCVRCCNLSIYVLKSITKYVYFNKLAYILNKCNAANVERQMTEPRLIRNVSKN